MCQHRELAYSNVHAVNIAGHVYYCCMHCLHACCAGKKSFMNMLTEFPADIPLDDDPRLDSEARITAAALYYPVIVSTRGVIIDGRHRIVKARRCMLMAMPTIMVTDEELLGCVY